MMMNHRFSLIPILLLLGLALVACGETTAVATPTAPPPAPTITAPTPATTVATPTAPPPAAEQQDSDVEPSLEAEDFGLAEWQVLVMKQIPFRGAQGQDLGSLYDWYTTDQATEEMKESVLRLVNLVLTPGHAVELPQRLVAEEIVMDPAASDNPLNKNQIVLRVDAGTGAGVDTYFISNPQTLTVDGEEKTIQQLIELAYSATDSQERQRYVQLARQSGLLVYTTSEIGGELRMATTPDGHRIMQRLDKDGNVVQETDKSALNWKVPLDAEKVFVAQGGENPFYTRENVNGGPAEAQSVYWDEDQRPLPPADFDTSGFRLSQKNGIPVYIDSAGYIRAQLANRNLGSAGEWEMLETSQHIIELDPFNPENRFYYRDLSGIIHPLPYGVYGFKQGDNNLITITNPDRLQSEGMKIGTISGILMGPVVYDEEVHTLTYPIGIPDQNTGEMVIMYIRDYMVPPREDIDAYTIRYRVGLSNITYRDPKTGESMSTRAMYANPDGDRDPFSLWKDEAIVLYSGLIGKQIMFTFAADVDGGMGATLDYMHTRHTDLISNCELRTGTFANWSDERCETAIIRLQRWKDDMVESQDDLTALINGSPREGAVISPYWLSAYVPPR
jgi:hypothetical protein